MPTILVVGRDAQLLQTRGSVLKLVPAIIVIRQPDELLSALNESVDLAVLCHTIRPPQRESVVAAIRQFNGIKILQIESTGHASIEDDLDGVAPREPRELTALVRKMLNPRETTANDPVL